MQIDNLEEAKVGKGRKDIDFGGELAEEFDGADAVGVEDVVDVIGEVMANGGWRDGDARGPLFDEFLDVEETVIA